MTIALQLFFEARRQVAPALRQSGRKIPGGDRAAVFANHVAVPAEGKLTGGRSGAVSLSLALPFTVALALAEGRKRAYQPDADESSHASMLAGRRKEAYRAFSLAFPPTPSV